MVTARDDLTAALSGVIPDTLRVIGYARSIDPPDKPTVLVRVDRVAPEKYRHRRYDFALVIIPHKAEAGPADDELDAALESVLDTLDAADNLTWSEATRGTYQDTAYPAYEVAVSLIGDFDPPTPTP